jgi:hypothetical protein
MVMMWHAVKVALRRAAPPALVIHSGEPMKNHPATRPAKLPLLLLGAAAALCLMLKAPDVQAHHAFAAEFDSKQPIDLQGTITKAKWVNPHSWLYFDVAAPDGKVTNWGVEFGAPNSLANKGLSKSDLKVGQPVRIKGFRSKNGEAFGYSVYVTLADGRTFQTGGAQDAPAAQAAQ